MTALVDFIRARLDDGETALRFLAAPFTDHPGFDPAWAAEVSS